MQSEHWFTVQEIVDMLQIHEQTVRRWLRTGELPGYNLGGKSGYRVKASELEKFLEERATGKELAA